MAWEKNSFYTWNDTLKRKHISAKCLDLYFKEFIFKLSHTNTKRRHVLAKSVHEWVFFWLHFSIYTLKYYWQGCRSAFLYSTKLKIYYQAYMWGKYSCQMSGSAFLQTHSLRVHLQKQMEDRLFSCWVCG